MFKENQPNGGSNANSREKAPALFRQGNTNHNGGDKMHKAIVEKLPVRCDGVEGTFTGVIYWERDMGAAIIERGIFQNIPKRIKTSNLIVDEAKSGVLFCLTV